MEFFWISEQFPTPYQGQICKVLKRSILLTISRNVLAASFPPQWINLIFFLITVAIKTNINTSEFQCAHSQTNHCKSQIRLVLECNIFMSDGYLTPLRKKWVLLMLDELILLYYLPMNLDSWWKQWNPEHLSSASTIIGQNKYFSLNCCREMVLLSVDPVAHVMEVFIQNSYLIIMISHCSPLRLIGFYSMGSSGDSRYVFLG